MVMTSDMIASQIGAIQQQNLMQMQQAQMMSQFGGMGGGDYAERFTGSAFNNAAAIGAPLATGGMMLAGMDPMSMAFRAGSSGMAGRFGMLGRVGMGVGAGLGVGAVMMGAQYAGSQMMTGMQEQQMLRNDLRSSFGHMNAMGGRGFTSSETANIGSFLRDYSSQRGSGGEFASMEELSRLASNMGRMGMSQGVKDAREFKEKFSEMMKTVKSIAEEFSTSLEEAQRIMSSMRGAGVFGNANQAAFGKGLRQAAVGTNSSMEEMTQMANVGSQIGRAIGGRGRSGAVAGVKALSTVAGALDVGALTEEDIYGATGLTGAEGKQAMATNMLRRDADFLKGGRGRQLLAAIAQKDGSIDMDAVRRIQSGEVSVGETISMRKDHLNTMSRANFIRNEGRLRGEALSAFGGMASSSAHMGWIRSKGYDPMSMDDKAMLAFQRYTGMDRDEADAEIKMLRNMDAIMDKRADRMGDDQITRSVERHNKTTGIEGVKRKLEGYRQDVNNTLKQAGADILTSAEDRVESFINSVMGEYVRRVASGTSEGVRLARQGSGGSATQALTGLGTKVDRGLIEKVYGAKIAYDPGTEGTPLGDIQATSEGARYRGISNYMLGRKGGISSFQKNAMQWGAAGGQIGQFLGYGLAAGAELFDTLGIGGGLSDSERKAGAAYLESEQGLSRSRQILGAKSIEERVAAADEQKALLAKLEKDKANKGEIDTQKRVTALARVRAGESMEAVLKETGFTKEELTRTEQVLEATVGADALTRARQAADPLLEETFSRGGFGGSQRAVAGISKGPVYDDQGNELKGIAAQRALKEGRAYKTAGGGALSKYNETMQGLSSEYSALMNKDTSKMSDKELQDYDIKKVELAQRTVEASKMGRASIEGLSESGLEDIIKQGGPLAAAARMELRQDKVLARAKKGKKGATIQAVASLFGGEMSTEDAAGLYGKSGDELLSAFGDSTGADLSGIKGDDRKALMAMLDKAAAGGDIDKELTAVEGTGLRKAFVEGQQKSQDVSAAMNDPSFRKLENIDKSMSEMVTLTKLISTNAAEQLETMKTGEGREENGG